MTRKFKVSVSFILISVLIGGLVNMKSYALSVDGLEKVCDYEGYAPTKYLDSVNVPTIAFGATASDIPDLKQWGWDKEISLPVALQSLREHSKKYADAVNRALKVDVTQYQFDALVAITYNIGVNGMAGSTFMKRVNAGESPKRVAEAMMMWNKGTVHGKRVVIDGLTNRRKAEGELFMTGNYKNDRKCTLISVNPKTHKPRYTGVIDLSQYL